MVAICAFLLMPIVWAVWSSLKPLDEVYAFPPRLIVEQPRWSNYQEIFAVLPLAAFLLNSVFISTIALVGAVVTSSMTAYALTRLEFRGRRICLWAVVCSLFLPSLILMIPRFMIYDVLGWIGTYKPLIVPAWLGGGAFNILLFRQSFLGLPRDCEDAAQMEGASHWRTYWQIVLPASKSALATAALLSFVFHWQEFLDPLLYLSDFQTFPVSLGLRMFQSVSGVWANLLMAASLVVLLPLVAVYCVYEFYLRRCQKADG